MTHSDIDPNDVRRALAEFRDPETGRSVTEIDAVQNIRVDGRTIACTLALTTFAAPLRDEINEAFAQLLRERFPQAEQVTVDLQQRVHRPEPLGEIGLRAKSVIAVGSGKGGVGKSTIAAALAYGLSQTGAQVGLMDADVYGPSIPHLLGVSQRPAVDEGKIQPIEVDGLKAISMGFLVAPDQAVVWRGPMLHGAITQLLRDTQWGDLDYMIIDMPPGTGDIAITLSQLIPLTGAVVVCTPQDVALLDAVKAIAMFRKVNIPLLGMVENMSYFICPDTGKRYDIFGSGGARQKAAELDMPFLGEVPINIQIRVRGDQGQIAGNFADETTAPYLTALYQNLVRNITAARRESPPLPNLTILG